MLLWLVETEQLMLELEDSIAVGKKSSCLRNIWKRTNSIRSKIILTLQQMESDFSASTQEWQWMEPSKEELKNILISLWILMTGVQVDKQQLQKEP